MKETLCLQLIKSNDSEQTEQNIGKLFGCEIKRRKNINKQFDIAGHDGELRCSCTMFSRSQELPQVMVRFMHGVILADDKYIPINEVHLKYDSEDIAYAENAVRKILENYEAILAEPELLLRLEQRYSVYDFRTLPIYKNSAIESVAVCHFPWQIYAVGQAWSTFLDKPSERVYVRQLRVKLRRLRSLLSFFKPLFVKEEISEWQRFFQENGRALGKLRELDVALMICEKIDDYMREPQEQTESMVAGIKSQLIKLRAERERDIVARFKLNEVTIALTKFLLWLQTGPMNKESMAYTVEGFVAERTEKWSKQIERGEKYLKDGNIAELHSLRIKIKKFRYIWQSLPELPMENTLWRQLKRLQDMLGLLHDDYVNTELIKALVKNTDGKKLQYEAGIFSGWEKAKAACAMEMLPEELKALREHLLLWRLKNL